MAQSNCVHCHGTGYRASAGNLECRYCAEPEYHVMDACWLDKGDVLYLHGYHVLITQVKDSRPDIFGRSMLRFDAEIIGGPDRIGDTGELTFGLSGVVKKVIGKEHYA